eukprot:6680472-Alexandrium_andersonii.AAC.1
MGGGCGSAGGLPDSLGEGSSCRHPRCPPPSSPPSRSCGRRCRAATSTRCISRSWPARPCRVRDVV